MNIGDFCNRKVVSTNARASLAEAAALMRRRHVGSLVVVGKKRGKRVPIGIVTDRDIVVSVLAAGVEYRNLSVGDVMSNRVVRVRTKDSVLHVLGMMRKRGIRRVPVVSPSGALVGIAAIDDVLGIVAKEIGAVVSAIGGEQAREAATRR